MHVNLRLKLFYRFVGPFDFVVNERSKDILAIFLQLWVPQFVSLLESMEKEHVLTEGLNATFEFLLAWFELEAIRKGWLWDTLKTEEILELSLRTVIAYPIST